jgi:membrane-bound serine protease (ClpP class)
MGPGGPLNLSMVVEAREELYDCGVRTAMRADFILLSVALAMLVSAAPGLGNEIVVLRLDDEIHKASQRFIERGLEEANAAGAELIIIELDTPGGYLDNTRDIASAMTSSKAPVAVYVSPAGARAASAGFFLLLAADIAAMAPGTNTGASHPVLVPMIPVGDTGEVPEEMMDKAVNDASAMVRSFAQDRGRNVEEAVKAVKESVSFTAQEALEKNLIDLIARSRAELIDRLKGREVARIDGTTQVLDLSGSSVREITPSRKEAFQSFMASPMVAFLLLLIAGLGIYTEITHPGGVFPGVVGVIALVLFLYSTAVLPVNWTGLALIVVAAGLFVLEVKVTSYGLLTLAGIACFIAGALMLFDTPIPEMRLPLSIIIPAACAMAGIMIFLLSRVIKAHQAPALTGKEGLIGEIGQALSDLAPAGKVKVHGEYWDAYCEGREIAAGTSVEVVAVRGRRLDVVPAQDHAAPAERVLPADKNE